MQKWQHGKAFGKAENTYVSEIPKEFSTTGLQGVFAAESMFAANGGTPTIVHNKRAKKSSCANIATEGADTDLGPVKRVTEGRDPGENLLHALTKRLNSCVAHLVQESPLHSCKGGGTGGQTSNTIGYDWVGDDADQTLHHNSTIPHGAPQEQLKMKMYRPDRPDKHEGRVQVAQAQLLTV